MKLTFECTCCGKDVDLTTEKPDSATMTEEDVVCPHCDSVYTVEVYFEEDGTLSGCQPFDYGCYLEHGDEEFTVCL